MRTIIFVAAALLVAGCETEDGWVPGENRVAENPHLAAHIAPAPQVISPAPPPAAAPPPVMAVAAAPPPSAPIASVPAPPEATSAEVAAAPVPNAIDAHCRAVAHQRASDAHANGFTFKMTDIIYAGTYKDCVAWDAQHGPSVAQ